MAKMVKCRTCGQMIAKSAKACPHCGAPNVPPLGTRLLMGLGAAVGGLVLAFVLILVIGTLLDDDSTNYGGTDAPEVQTSEQEQAGDAASAEPAAEQDSRRVLYDGDTMKATLIRIYEDDITKSVGSIAIAIEFENKSDVGCMFLLSDVAVNDHNVIPLGGNPFETKPGEKVIDAFTLGLGNTDATSIDDVWSVKFCCEQANYEHISERICVTDRYEAAP